MAWLADALRGNPALARFLVLAVGFVLGQVRLGSVIGMHPGVLLGVCAGTGTSGPTLAAIEREADSQVPTIHYGMGDAVGNLLTALGGTLLVLAGP